MPGEGTSSGRSAEAGQAGSEEPGWLVPKVCAGWEISLRIWDMEGIECWVFRGF